MKRIFDDAPDEFTQDQPSQKKKRMSRFEGGATSDPVGNGIPSSQNIQELLASTKKQIEERKKQTQALLAQQQVPTAALLPTPSAPPVNMYSAAEHVMSAAMSEAVEKARKAAEVRISPTHAVVPCGSPSGSACATNQPLHTPTFCYYTLLLRSAVSETYGYYILGTSVYMYMLLTTHTHTYTHVS